MNEKRTVKRKLIAQSFMPLFVILAIKNFDFEIFIVLQRLIKHLLNKDWLVILRMPNHPLTLICAFEMICILWILYAAFSILEFVDMQTSNFVSQNESVKECENISDSGVTFFMTYVLPMVMDDIGTIKGFLIFTLLMIMLCMLMWKTNLYYQNPILTILGYDVLSFKFEHTQLRRFENQTCVGITRNTKIEDGMHIKRQYIADNVFLIYKNL
jgi:hypothetical protein